MYHNPFNPNAKHGRASAGTQHQTISNSSCMLQPSDPTQTGTRPVACYVCFMAGCKTTLLNAVAILPPSLFKTKNIKDSERLIDFLQL